MEVDKLCSLGAFTQQLQYTDIAYLISTACCGVHSEVNTVVAVQETVGLYVVRLSSVAWRPTLSCDCGHNPNRFEIHLDESETMQVIKDNI